MPRLLLFAPCEKAIISQDENTPTLISVLTGMKGTIQLVDENQQIGPETHAPVKWTIFSMWKHEPGDEANEFEQLIKVNSPSGKPAMSIPTVFKIDKDSTHRIIHNVATLPIGEPGIWMLELYVNKKGEQTPATPLATYPLKIEMVVKKTK